MPADAATGLKAQFTLRLPPPLLEFVDQQATSAYLTRNAYIQQLITREFKAQASQQPQA